MAEKAQLIIDGKTYTLPVVIGSEGEKALDISCLRKETGYVTLDPGYANTGSCISAITFVDGEKGIVRYRGIPVEELAEHSSFVETSYLLIFGELPSMPALRAFSELLNDHSLVHEDMREFFESFPRRAHPMGILSSMGECIEGVLPGAEGEESGGRDKDHLRPVDIKNEDDGRNVLQNIERSQGRLSTPRFELLRQFFKHDVRLSGPSLPTRRRHYKGS